MDIRNRTELKQFALQRLENARDEKKLAAIFAGVVIGLSLLSAVINYCLGLGIDNSGGLSNIGTRTVLSTLQTMLPLISNLITMCMTLGYMSAMLRISRGQYASPNSLRLGFDRFWVLLRYTVIESVLFLGIGFASTYAGVLIFLLTPFSRSTVSLLAPVMSQMTLLDSTYSIPNEIYGQLLTSMIPAYIFILVIYAIAAIPLMYRLRMTKYVLIDRPGKGAFAAIRESRAMMRGNCRNLFRLDLSLWWFYAASMAASVVCYGDMILPLLGIRLPFPEDVNFFLFYGLYWALEFIIFYFLRNRVEVAYALAYDALRPEEKQDGGVVLGNIFQM